MERQFQNIIVGAGIAGLICGGYLSKYGQRTLVLEKRRELGGRVRHYAFNGFSPMIQGVTLFLGWDGGFWTTAARELDVNVKYFISPPPASYQRGSHHPPKILPKCCTAPALVSYIESQLPEPMSANLKEEFHRIFKEILSIPYKKLCMELDTISLKDWLVTRSSDPMVHNFFIRMGANMMMMDATRAGEILCAGKIFAIIRMWLAGEGFTAGIYPNPFDGLIKPFGEAIQSLGCQIKTNHEVREIIMEGNKAVGVVVKKEGGTEEKIYAERVIINALYPDIPRLFKELPPELEEPCRRLEELWMVDYWTFTGLREKITDDPSYVMVQDPVTGSNLGGILPQSLGRPWTAPPGKQLIWMEKIYSREDFKKLKEEEIRAEMNDIQEEVYPGFKKAIEVQKYASHQPLFHHQWAACPKIPQKASTVENLYFTGDSTTPLLGQGFDGAASTGILCAKRILGI